MEEFIKEVKFLKTALKTYLPAYKNHISAEIENSCREDHINVLIDLLITSSNILETIKKLETK